MDGRQDTRCRPAQGAARSSPATAPMSRQGIRLPRHRGAGPAARHQAASPPARRDATRVQAWSTASLGRRANEQLAQQLPRAAHSLGADSRALPGAPLHGVRADRVPRRDAQERSPVLMTLTLTLTSTLTLTLTATWTSTPPLSTSLRLTIG